LVVFLKHLSVHSVAYFIVWCAIRFRRHSVFTYSSRYKDIWKECCDLRTIQERRNADSNAASFGWSWGNWWMCVQCFYFQIYDI